MKRWIHASEWVDLEDENIELARSTSDADTLAELADERSDGVRFRVAKNPSTPSDILAKLAYDKDEFTKYAALANPNVPVDVLVEYSRSADQLHAHVVVAENPSTPSDILAKLAGHDYFIVREGVAKNPSTPSNVLSNLASDEVKDVRVRVASNPNTPEYILSELANDSAFDVRRQVAKNPNTPSEILEELRVSTKQDKAWESLVNEVVRESESGIDSLYSQTDAGIKIEGICQGIEGEIGVWIEPSVQDGVGNITIRDSKDDSVLTELDYETFNDIVTGMVVQSRTKSEFQKKYKKSLESLLR